MDLNTEDVVDVLRELTQGAGPDEVIDAVGVESERPKTGPGAAAGEEQADEYAREIAQNAPETGVRGDQWKPGDAPSQAARWYIEAIAIAGTTGVGGVYPPTMEAFPIGQAMHEDLNLRMGTCPHRRFIPEPVDLVASGVVDPFTVLTQSEPIADAVEAYRTFDRREPGWTKVALETSEAATGPA